jgi:hypothetical protein
MALVGLNSLKSSLPNYDADKFQITDGNATFELSSESAKAQFGNSLLELKTKIKLANNSKNLKAVLDEIVDVISNLQVVVSGGSSAGSWPVSPATTSAAAAAKTSIGGLLE